MVGTYIELPNAKSWLRDHDYGYGRWVKNRTRTNEILRELDYEKKRMTVGGKRKYVWAKNEILTMKSKEA